MGKRSLQAGRTCRSTASGKLCSLYVWTKTSIDVFSSNHTQHSRLLEPLENASASIFLPALVDHNCPPPPTPTLNARSCCYQLIGSAKPCNEATSEHLISMEVTTPLIEKIQSQPDQLPEDSEVQHLNKVVKVERNEM